MTLNKPHNNLGVSMKTIIILALTLGIVGCASIDQADSIPSATAMTDTSLAAAPQGWVDYCQRHAEDPSCRL